MRFVFGEIEIILGGRPQAVQRMQPECNLMPAAFQIRTAPFMTLSEAMAREAICRTTSSNSSGDSVAFADADANDAKCVTSPAFDSTRKQTGVTLKPE